MKYLHLLAGPLLIVVALAGCTRDPNALKLRDLERGDRYLAEKKYAEAAIEYSKALQRDPNFSEAYARLGRLYMEEGNQLNAWQALQRAAALAPDDIDLQIEAGGMLLLARRFDDARRLADAVLAKSPNHVPALVLRANSLVGLEDMDSAIKLVEEAVRLAPGESDLYSNLASLQATAGDLEEAERTYRRAVDAAPTRALAYLPLGNFYWATGRPGQAEQAFRKALEVEPDNVMAHRAMATFYLGAGRPLEAEPSLKFLADSSSDIEHRITLGDYYLVTGRLEQGEAVLREVARLPGGEAKANTRLAAAAYASNRRDEAQAMLDAVLAKSPHFAQALLLKARFALERGDRPEALALATRATSAQPDFIEAWYMIGELYAEAGDMFQAAEAYRKIIEVNPFAQAAHIQLARAMYARGEVQASNEYLDDVIRRASEDRGTRLALARALIERRDLRGAEVQLRDVLEQSPDDPELHALMGTLSALKRDLPVARSWYERALKADPRRADAISGLIGLDIESGRPADARRRAEAVAAVAAPGFADPLMLLAKTYGAIGELDLAERTLRRAIDLDPKGYEAYDMLGHVLYERGRLAEGRAEFEKLSERLPRSVAAHTMIGIILRAEGQTDAAIERYKRALEIDPEAPVAANNLAWIYAEQGVNLDEAVILAKAARKHLPDSVDVGDTLGWVYYRNGHPNLLSLAIPLLEETVQKAPDNPLFRYHLGAAYARLGRVIEARRELNEALRLSNDFRGSAETRRILATLR